MADTVKLRFSEAGCGIPLVMLHGFPLTSAIWHSQQKQLSDQFRVITPDLRGHGQSPVPGGIYQMADMAEDVLALLDVLRIEQAVLLGHSMGGYVALAAARLAPGRLLALGLVASHAGADTEAGRQGRLKLAETVASEGARPVATAMLPKLFAPGLSLESPIVAQVKEMILDTPSAAIVGSLQGMAARPDSHDLVRMLPVPVLLLTGDEDQLIPRSKAESLAVVVPRPTLTIIERAGHMPMLEQPEAATAAIRAFVTAVGKSS